jgi:hypothetical protein
MVSRRLTGTKAAGASRAVRFDRFDRLDRLVLYCRFPGPATWGRGGAPAALLLGRRCPGSNSEAYGSPDVTKVVSVRRNPDGRHDHPGGFSREFDRRVPRHGLPRIRLHDLRHPWATLALEAGIPVEIVAERLGHSVAVCAATLESAVAHVAEPLCHHLVCGSHDLVQAGVTTAAQDDCADDRANPGDADGEPNAGWPLRHLRKTKITPTTMTLSRNRDGRSLPRPLFRLPTERPSVTNS